MRMTLHVKIVLKELSKGSNFGLELARMTGIDTGTLYPILHRFQKHELVSVHYEDLSISRARGKPQRKYYTLTEKGERIANSIGRVADF